MKIYIDGENFRHKAVDILQSGRIIANSREMGKYPLRKLLEDVLASKDVEIVYYSSRLKLPRGYQPSDQILEKAEIIKEFNRHWVAQLRTQNIQHIKAGYLKVKNADSCPNCGHRQEILQEKGVDVRIAVDLITDSHDTDSKTIALMSSDSDLIPALDRIQRSGIKVIYICFANAVNQAMSSTADETITIPTAKVRQIYQHATNEDRPAGRE